MEKSKGIKEIAQTLGISIGTVDRALHGRSGVSAKTRDRVMKLAERFQYSPNLAARNLKLNRSLKIGVYLPQQIASYYDLLREGIRTGAAAETSVQTSLEFFDYSRLGDGDVAAMRRAIGFALTGSSLHPDTPGSYCPSRQRPWNMTSRSCASVRMRRDCIGLHPSRRTLM